MNFSILERNIESSSAPFPVKAGHHFAGVAATPNEGMFEREFRAADRDLVVAETDLADDEADIGLPQCRIVGLELFPGACCQSDR